MDRTGCCPRECRVTMNWRVRSSCTLLAILSLTVAVASPSNAAAPNKYGVTSGDNGVPADASVTTDQAVGGYAIQVRTRSNGNGAGGAPAATGGGAEPELPTARWHPGQPPHDLRRWLRPGVTGRLRPRRPAHHRDAQAAALELDVRARRHADGHPARRHVSEQGRHLHLPHLWSP